MITNQDAKSFMKVMEYHRDLFANIAKNYFDDNEIVAAVSVSNYVEKILYVRGLIRGNLEHEDIL